MKSDWFAIRLESGAARKARDRHVVEGPKGGRRLVSEESEESVIERGCKQIGVELFVPMETRMIIHHRSKKPTTKRLPMLPGFAFVRGVSSFPELEGAAGVSEVLGISGAPYAIPAFEIQAVQDAETATTVTAHADIAKWYQDREKITRRRLLDRYPVGRRIVVKHGPFAGQSSQVDAVTGRKTVRAMLALLGSLTPVEIPITQIETAA